MAKYVIIYHEIKVIKTKEDQMADKQKYMDWIEELGDAMINPGTPFMNNKFIDSEGNISDAGSKKINGFSVIEAESIEKACELAKNCPYLEIGTLEIAEMTEMKM